MSTKQQQLTDLALRKVYHAEQLGLDAATVQQMRDGVRDVNAKLDHAARYIEQEAAMLNVIEKTVLFQSQWDQFVTALAALGLAASEWTRIRMSSPDRLKLGKA